MTVHIVGAGMAGLSAACQLVKKNIDVVLYDASNHAGGRCFSFQDKKTNALTDNGTHLILGANRALLSLLNDCDTQHPLVCYGNNVPFYNVETKKSFVVSTTFPFKSFFSFLKIKNLLIESVMNTPAQTADIKMFLKTALKCFGKENGKIYLAEPSLADCVVRPLVDFLKRHNVPFVFGASLRSVSSDKLVFFNKKEVIVQPDDFIILALPVMALSRLIAGISEPKHSTIINIHYQFNARLPDNLPFCGLLNGMGHFVFSRKGLISVTISAANDLLKKHSENFIAGTVWAQLKPLLKTTESIPPYRFIADSQATLYQDRQTNRLSSDIGHDRIFLAGDGTDTGLPCTIESAVLSGFKASEHILKLIVR